METDLNWTIIEPGHFMYMTRSTISAFCHINRARTRLHGGFQSEDALLELGTAGSGRGGGADHRAAQEALFCLVPARVHGNADDVR